MKSHYAVKEENEGQKKEKEEEKRIRKNIDE